MSLAFTVPQVGVKSVYQGNVQRLLRSDARSKEVRAGLSTRLKCNILRMPVATGEIPYALYKNDDLICFMDFIYVEGTNVLGTPYSTLRRNSAKILTMGEEVPAYLVMATDDDVYWIDILTKRKLKVFEAFLTEDTREIVPCVFFEIGQFGRMELDQEDNLILLSAA